MKLFSVFMASIFAVFLMPLPKPEIPQFPSQPPQKMHILTWPGYVERGETDKNFNWVTAFEQETHCQISVHEALSDLEFRQALKEPGSSFDIVISSGDIVMALMEEQQLQPIDVTRVANYGALSPALTQTAWNSLGTEIYGVPVQWAPQLLAYNSLVFPNAPTSWSVVFNAHTYPDGKPNRSRISAHANPMYIALAALYLKVQKPALHIANPYELTREQFNAVTQLLETQHDLVDQYWQDALTQVRKLEGGDIIATDTWPFQQNLLASQGAPILTVAPREGLTGWADHVSMPRSAQATTCAYHWINHVLGKKTQGDMAAWLGSVPALPAACQGNSILTDNGCQTNGAGFLHDVWFWRRPHPICVREKTCVSFLEWQSTYARIKKGNPAP